MYVLIQREDTRGEKEDIGGDVVGPISGLYILGGRMYIIQCHQVPLLSSLQLLEAQKCI